MADHADNETNNGIFEVSEESTGSLLDVAEPDDAFLIASEQEQNFNAPRRALVVVITDHPDENSDDTSRLVGELLSEVLDQMVPGIAQALRSSGQACGAVDACTSRGISGVSGSTVIVNLASSRAAVRDGMATLAPLVHYLIDQLQKYSV